MKKKVILALITPLIISNIAYAEFGYGTTEDFTGEAFFNTPLPINYENKTKNHGLGKTQPPLKKLRLTIQNSLKHRNDINNELAPTYEDIYKGEVETSEYASKEIKENFDDEIISPDGFEADDSAIQEQEKKRRFFKKKEKKSENKNTEEIILNCQNVDYDSKNYLMHATGDVSIKFVKQGTTVIADIITFDRANNTVKAEGNVKILKGNQVITGDYIFADLNEENALIDNPLTTSTTVEVKSEKGYVYNDKIVQENGSMNVSGTFPIFFISTRRTPQTHRMLTPEDKTLTEDMENGLIKFKAKEIKITQNDKLEIITLKRPRIFKNDKLIFKTPSAKLYTNKNLEFAETNHWEIGAYRGLGMYAGPGFALGFPQGAALKVMPIVNYKSGFGFGAYGRFSNATNHTIAAYGSAAEKFVLYGKQELDDNLFLQYAVNGYMDEWFMGRRRPKYGTGLVYKKAFSSDNFLYKNHLSTFTHRLEAGYYNDLDFDRHFEKLSGSDFGTTRFRYMAQGTQNLYNYKNEDKLTNLSLDVITQLSAAIYGSGQTQVVARVAPNLHLQYRRWMQDLGFYVSAYDDNTPMPVFDAYRYGKQALYIREYFRICKLLTVAWFGNANLTNDSPNGKIFQENTFYLSIGPDDLKFNIGYDFVRENLYAGFLVNMDAKGTKVEYEKFEIKQHNKTKNTTVEKAPEPESDFKMSGTPVLRKAVVENLREIEDVI